MRIYRWVSKKKGTWVDQKSLNIVSVQRIRESKFIYSKRSPKLIKKRFYKFSLLWSRQGDDWHRVRSPLQQLLIKPRSALRYLPKMDKCAQDFVDLMKATKSANGEVPEFQQTMYRWAIECKLYRKLNVSTSGQPKGWSTIFATSSWNTYFLESIQIFKASLFLILAFHLSMSSISRYPRKNRKSKILAWSNFALASCAQYC